MSESGKSFNFEISESGNDKLYGSAEDIKDFFISLDSVFKRTRTTLKTKAWNEVSQRYNVKKSDFNRYTKIEHRDELSEYGSSTGVVFRGEKIPLSSFVSGGRKLSGIVKARVKKAGKTAEYRHAFNRYADGRSKVFERITSARLPLREITALAVPQMINNKDVIEAMKTEAYLTLDKRVDHEIKRLINGWGVKK